LPQDSPNEDSMQPIALVHLHLSPVEPILECGGLPPLCFTRGLPRVLCRTTATAPRAVSVAQPSGCARRLSQPSQVRASHGGAAACESPYRRFILRTGRTGSKGPPAAGRLRASLPCRMIYRVVVAARHAVPASPSLVARASPHPSQQVQISYRSRTVFVQ
jgi:hypothetical protein